MYTVSSIRASPFFPCKQLYYYKGSACFFSIAYNIIIHIGFGLYFFSVIMCMYTTHNGAAFWYGKRTDQGLPFFYGKRMHITKGSMVLYKEKVIDENWSFRRVTVLFLLSGTLLKSHLLIFSQPFFVPNHWRWWWFGMEKFFNMEKWDITSLNK